MTSPICFSYEDFEPINGSSCIKNAEHNLALFRRWTFTLIMNINTVCAYRKMSYSDLNPFLNQAVNRFIFAVKIPFFELTCMWFLQFVIPLKRLHIFRPGLVSEHAAVCSKCIFDYCLACHGLALSDYLY